jgi:hypothetical protein
MLQLSLDAELGEEVRGVSDEVAKNKMATLGLSTRTVTNFMVKTSQAINASLATLSAEPGLMFASELGAFCIGGHSSTMRIDVTDAVATNEQNMLRPIAAGAALWLLDWDYVEPQNLIMLITHILQCVYQTGDAAFHASNMFHAAIGANAVIHLPHIKGVHNGRNGNQMRTINTQIDALKDWIAQARDRRFTRLGPQSRLHTGPLTAGGKDTHNIGGDPLLPFARDDNDAVAAAAAAFSGHKAFKYKAYMMDGGDIMTAMHRLVTIVLGDYMTRDQNNQLLTVQMSKLLDNKSLFFTNSIGQLMYTIHRAWEDTRLIPPPLDRNARVSLVEDRVPIPYIGALSFIVHGIGESGNGFPEWHLVENIDRPSLTPLYYQYENTAVLDVLQSNLVTDHDYQLSHLDEIIEVIKRVITRTFKSVLPGFERRAHIYIDRFNTSGGDVAGVNAASVACPANASIPAPYKANVGRSKLRAPKVSETTGILISVHDPVEPVDGFYGPSRDRGEFMTYFVTQDMIDDANALVLPLAELITFSYSATPGFPNIQKATIRRQDTYTEEVIRNLAKQYGKANMITVDYVKVTVDNKFVTPIELVRLSDDMHDMVTAEPIVMSMKDGTSNLRYSPEKLKQYFRWKSSEEEFSLTFNVYTVPMTNHLETFRLETNHLTGKSDPYIGRLALIQGMNVPATFSNSDDAKFKFDIKTQPFTHVHEESDLDGLELLKNEYIGV